MPIENLITEARALLGEGGCLTDSAQTASYTTSMRHRHLRPTPLVALPRSVQQVSDLVQLCRKHRVGMVPQGGNTGLVDGGLPNVGGEDIIINLSRMNAIRALDSVGMIATVEAGVILQNLHKAAEAEGLMFPLWIPSEGSAEIGGLISTNAGGVSALRYGTMRAQVLGIEAVLPNGEIVSNLKALAKDNTGYHLSSCFIGAEGTLGIVTAATLRLLPIAKQKVTAMLAVADVNAALRLLDLFRREAAEYLSAFEFMSLAALQLLMRKVQGARFPFNRQDAPYYVLVELSASLPLAPLRSIFEALASSALETGLALDAALAENETQAAQFWHAREHIPEALRSEKQRIHFDIALSLKSLPDFLIKTELLIKAEFPAITLMPFGHIGDGNVHYNMYFSEPVEQFDRAKARIQDVVFGEVENWQGSISAEHGIGVERKAVLAKTKSPAELTMMRAIKGAFDPDNLMNPGKIFDVGQET